MQPGAGVVAKKLEQSESEEIVGLWTTLPVEEMLPFIVRHIQQHLDELESGIFNHLYPPKVIKLLIKYNKELVESLQSGIGDMSPEAVLAVYHAYQNEENSLTAEYHPKDLNEALGRLASAGFYITSRGSTTI